MAPFEHIYITFTLTLPGNVKALNMQLLIPLIYTKNM